MLNKKNCAGTYPVRGYKRSDGTEVSAYMRTCGAKHVGDSDTLTGTAGNIDDIDLKNNGIKVHRKGGADVIVYFGTEVRDALCDYLEERNGITAVAGHEEALFLSLQNKRISVRAVENLVKKYSKLVTNLKNITPHKLRSTYGTSLYRETGDIYLVADVLGHKDVNTTRKHYAAIEDDRRRKAAKYVHLREEDDEKKED